MQIVYDNLYPTDASALQLHYLKGVILVVYAFMQAKEVSLDFEQHSCQSISIAFHIAEGVVIDIKNSAQIT